MAEQTQKQTSNQSNTNSNTSSSIPTPTIGTLISQEQYDVLPEDEKANWVRYNPETSDEGVEALIKKADAELNIMQMFAPALEKVKIMPQPLPAEQIDKALDSLEKALKLLDPIKALTKVPIIGGLAQAVVNILNTIIQLIGMGLMIEFYIARGAPIFTDQITKTWDQLDFDKIGDKIKEMKELMNKPTTNGIKPQIKYDKMPNEQIKKKIQELEKTVESASSTVDLMNAASRAMDITIDAIYAQVSWEVQFKHIQKALGKLGLDLSPLNQPTEAQMKAFDKMIPNPKIQMNKLQGALDELKNDKKYMCIAEVVQEKEEEEDVEIAKTQPKEAAKAVLLRNTIQLSDRLTPHFILNDLCKSDTARKCGIKNIPDALGVEKLRFLAETILEPVYKRYGKLCINSGYRGPALNRAVGGKETSQHCKCEACDIEVMGVNNFELAEWIRTNCEYDQLILEYAGNLTNDPNSGWVHVSVKREGNRHQCLSINKAGTFKGLQKVCYPQK